MSVLLSHRSIGSGSTSLADHTYDLLRDQIVTFEYKPFDALSEKRISETVGVSRTPVREALARLAAQHLVDIYPQRGTFVAPLRRTDLERAQFMREALEIGLVHRAAAVADRTPLLKQLQAEVKLQQMFSEMGEEARFYGSDEDFHRAIAVFAGPPGVWDEIKRLKLHMDRYRHLVLATVEKDLGAIAAQHQAIIDALATGDAAAAGDAMRRHLRRIFGFADKVMAIHPGYFETTRDPAAANI